MKLIALLLMAWLAGLLSYVANLRLFYAEGISPGDLGAVMLWSALALVVATVIAYAPVLFLLRHWRGGTRPRWLFTIAAVALAIVPVALILAVWRGLSLEALISDETRLFWAFFIPVGVVLGHGFSWLYRDRAA